MVCLPCGVRPVAFLVETCPMVEHAWDRAVDAGDEQWMLETSSAFYRPYLPHGRFSWLHFTGSWVGFLYFVNKDWRKLDFWPRTSQLFCWLYTFLTKYYIVSFEIYKTGLNSHSESYVNVLSLLNISTSFQGGFIASQLAVSHFLICEILS